MSTNCRSLLLSTLLLLSLAMAPLSHAGPLVAVGPRDLPIPPGDGFPMWYQDANGLSLGKCLDVTFCGLLPDAGFDPGLPISFPTNYPEEQFYFLAESFVGPNSILYVAAIEGAFGGVGGVADGQQTVFMRIRIRGNVDVPGTYTFTHPYGVETFVVDAIDPGAPEINFTNDLTPAGLIFDGPLSPAAVIGPFLESTAGRITDPATGNIYIGNPAGVTTVTGSPFGTNFLQIVGPGLNATANTFTLQGRVIGNDVNPKALTFAPQMINVVSPVQTVTVTNISTTTTLQVAVTKGGTNPGAFAITADLCTGVVIPANGTCTFGVTFSSPNPTPAARTATAVITTTAPVGMPPMSVALNGTIDAVPPTVTSTFPAAAQTVPSNSTVTAIFSEPMNAATVNGTNFTVTGPAGAVAGTVTFDAVNNIATFTAADPAGFTANQAFTVNLLAGVTDAAGNPLAPLTFNFNTVPPDFTPPGVVSTSPAANAKGVPLNTPIMVTFTEEMHGASINASTFLVSGAAGAVTASAIVFDTATKTATFTPAAPLAAGALYTITVKGGVGGVDDLAQNTLPSDFSVQFIANNPPAVPVLVSPANGVSGTGTTVTFTWNKSTDPDGDPLTYHIEVCDNPFLLGCAHEDVPAASLASLSNNTMNGGTMAGLGGLGMAAMGLVFFGGLKGRKGFLSLALLGLMVASGTLISACGGGGDDPPPAPTNTISFTKAGLASGVQHFWRVEVHDPNNGSAFTEIQTFTP